MRKCATPTSAATDLNHDAVPWGGGKPRYKPGASFPRSRVGMQPVTLSVARAQWPKPAAPGGTRSVPGGIPTQSVGTISGRHSIRHQDRSHAPAWECSRDAPRRPCTVAKTCGAWGDAERPRRHSHAERGNDQCAPAPCRRFVDPQGLSQIVENKSSPAPKRDI